MRKVDKSNNIPFSLVKPGGMAQKLLIEAKAFFADPNNKNKKFDFNYYSETDVKTSLEFIFSKKCAYCESNYAGSSILEVEHFRPKSVSQDLEGNRNRPGYFWLAWSWDNLLPACQNCNRRYYRKILGQELPVLNGKGELFPLSDESKRAKKPGDERYEEPLLLNPCIDDPKEHIYFTDDGMVLPLMIKGMESKIGFITISVLGLQREDLVYERKKIAKSLNARILNLKNFELMSQANPANTDLIKLIKSETLEIKEFLEADKPYLSMVQQIIEKKIL